MPRDVAEITPFFRTITAARFKWACNVGHAYLVPAGFDGFVDALGAAVLPGFNDASTHFIAGGLALDEVDLTGASTLEEIQGRVQTWAESHPDRPWITGRGWQPSMFATGASRQQLDSALSDRPVCLLSADGRAADGL